ncbi:MAG: thiamine diphosphokinase [Clostridia bacterium]
MIANLVLNGDICFNQFDKNNFTMCADGGYNAVRANGFNVDCVVGDMDSINITNDCKESIRLNPEKDFTDGEFALQMLLDKGFKKINIFGVEGGRLDHVLTNLDILSKAIAYDVEVVCRCANYNIFVTNKTFAKKCVVGKTISVVPFLTDVHIISTQGLYYPVKNNWIKKGASLGISNVVTEQNVEIKIDEGNMLVFELF